MPFYLSYVEYQGHSAFMLSQQTEDSEPVKIISEIGFGLRPGINPTAVDPFSAYKGNVRDEVIASRAMYGASAPVKHRTYEISAAEMEKFNSIIEGDRSKNRAVLLQENAKEKAVGGPDYQLFSSNCKTYAMGVLKAVGIMDADNLSNFLVQRPGSTDSLLQSIDPDELYRPGQEGLNKEITSVLTLLESEMVSTKEALSKNPPIDFLVIDGKIQMLLEIADFCLKNKGKTSLIKKFEEMNTLLSEISAFPIPTEGIKSVQAKIGVLIEADKSLKFHWKKVPPLAKRLDLDKFNDQEKRNYLRKIKINETSDGLNQILKELKNKIKTVDKNSDEALHSDLSELIIIIQKAKKKVDQSQQTFLKSLSKNPEKVASEEAWAQLKVNEALNHMQSALGNFKQKSKETNPFIRFINRVMGYVNKDFIKIENVTSVVKDKLVNIRRSLFMKNNNTVYKEHDEVKPKQDVDDELKNSDDNLPGRHYPGN